MLDIVNKFSSYFVPCSEEFPYISKDTRFAIKQGAK